MGVVLIVAVIVCGFFYRKPNVENKLVVNNDSSHISTEVSSQQDDEYKEHREKLAQALSLQGSASLTETEKINWKIYKSEKYGFQFQYPENYLVMEDKELEPSENAGAIFRYILVPDNNRNRNYLSEQSPDAEPPSGISVIVYPKDASKPNLTDWVPNIITAEEKEVLGIYQITTVSGREALIYTTSTMYEYDNVVIANGNNVYNFNVGFTGSDDVMRKDFYKSLSTVTFN